MAIGSAATWLRPARLPAAGTLVVIGNGMASHRLCARLLEQPLPPARRVVVIGEEPRPAYDRVHLSDVLGGRALRELELAPADWYAQRGIELWLGDPVRRIDLDARRIETRSGRAQAFDQLVFATGSAALRPPLSGVDLPNVHVYRSAEDVEAIAAAAGAAGADGARVAVLGGGLLGIEAAYAMQRLGCRVEVIERAAHLLPRQLDAAAARVLERQIRALGIGVSLARNATAIEPCASALRLAGGDADAFAFVVVAAGVRPRDELARACGVACHPRGGILVDDQLAASEPGVYAIGECARHQGVLYGLAAPCLGMADVLADRLGGGARRFRRVTPATRLKLDCVDVSVAGDTNLDGHGIARISHGGGALYRSLVLREWHVVGAVAVGDWPEWHRVQEAIARQRLLLPWQRSRLKRSGRAFGESASVPIARWPDATTVCTCMGVDCGTLRVALA